MSLAGDLDVMNYVEPVISKVGKNTIMVTVGRGDFWISTVIVQGKV